MVACIQNLRRRPPAIGHRVLPAHEIALCLRVQHDSRMVLTQGDYVWRAQVDPLACRRLLRIQGHDCILYLIALCHLVFDFDFYCL